MSSGVSTTNKKCIHFLAKFLQMNRKFCLILRLVKKKRECIAINEAN